MHKLRTAALPLLFLLTAASAPELARWRATAERVTITRDDWGIAHIDGRTDADAVFGMIYAQAEDDFRRIEDNYLTALGRKAEAEGEGAMWEDLRARLYVSEAELKAYFAQSPPALQKLMNAWADGLNFFLATHPNVRPRVIKRFQPWMVLSFTEGSIGGDIEKIDLGELQKFYSSSPRFRREGDRAKHDGGAPPSALRAATSPANAGEGRGSNGIAIAPALSRDGNALLLINPHTSFFFRSEQQVTSGEGLNVYGAATWGQFFIYQGFNANAGWMHTSSGVDNIDEFAERIERSGTARCYRYGSSCRPIGVRPVTIRYRTAQSRIAARSFNTYFTHHGPVVRSDGARWIAFAMMDRPVQALQQSFLRTKARDLESFLAVAQLKSNSSNNTIFASSKGEVAYLHPHFVLRRADRFDYTKPVDGSDPATDWGSLHALQELPNAVNPPNGWVQNTNAWPYRAAGEFSPNPVRYPKYMDMFGENFRGLRALQLLTRNRGWTLDRLQAAAFDNYQTGFAAQIPALLKAYDRLSKADPRREQLAGPIAALRGWDFRSSAQSVPQSLAMLWGLELRRLLAAPADQPSNITMMQLARRTTDAQKLDALTTAIAQLQRDFGRWQVPWGEINRLQRLPSTNPQAFSDDAPSTPVPFASALWGSLPAFGFDKPPPTRRWYGTKGNSFVAVVEFGPRVRARAVSAGGASGNPASPHFNDQSLRYAAGALRDVYFYPEQLTGHIERRYRPGD